MANPQKCPPRVNKILLTGKYRISINGFSCTQYTVYANYCGWGEGMHIIDLNMLKVKIYHFVNQKKLPNILQVYKVPCGLVWTSFPMFYNSVVIKMSLKANVIILFTVQYI